MADSRITDYTRTTVTSGTTIDPADENTNRTNIATAINNANDVLTDLETGYASSSEPTSKVTGKRYHDTGITYNKNQWYDGSAFRPWGYDADFRSKNLLIDVDDDENVTATADFITVLNSTGDYYLIADLDETFDITTDIHAGTVKASTNYWLWISATDAGVITSKLAPDLVSTADGNTANKLIDSAADFVTDAVSVGDELYNTTDLTKGYVGAVDDLNTISCVDADGAALDLFPDGNENYLIRILSPTGIGTYKARIGAAHTDSSSDFDNSFYTQIQEPKYYSEAAGDYTISTVGATLSSTNFHKTCVRQIMDWTGVSVWESSIKFFITLSVADLNFSVSQPGVVFDGTIILSCASSNTGDIVSSYTFDSTGQVQVRGDNARTDWYSSGNVYTTKKPTFHI